VFGVFILIAAAAAPSTTDEIFHAAPSEMAGPCSLKISGETPDEPPAECAAAIAAANTPKEKAILYFAWAYSLNEAGAGVQALPNLDKAIALAPNFINARHERGYTLNDLGYYDRALVDSDRDVQLQPNRADAYRERAFARHHLADFGGSLADRFKDVELSGSTHGAEIAITEDLMWLGRYDEAAKRLAAVPESDDDKALRTELNRRRQFKPDGGEASRCALAKSVNDRTAAQKMVDDCTWAFDHERDPVKRADFLTTRYVNSVVALQDRDAHIPDLEIAAALDPNSADRHSNLGYAYLGVHHSWAARNEFDRALSVPNIRPKSKMLALTGRGQARANLGDSAGAFADGKASFEIEPSAPNTWLLGDLAFAKGDKAVAKKLWLASYHLGSRDDALLRKLKSVGVEDPAKEPR